LRGIPLLDFPELCKDRVYIFKGCVCLLSHLKCQTNRSISNQTPSVCRSQMMKQEIFGFTLAPVITIFPETKIRSTIFGCFMRYIRPGKSSGSYCINRSQLRLILHKYNTSPTQSTSFRLHTCTSTAHEF